jgi:hypothetical protein
MKIAIQGHLTRWKEVISLLESLGGINKAKWVGDGRLYTYYIDKDKDNRIEYGRAPKNYTVYTLEEFETQFPFKIGDIVSLKGVNKPYKIIALEWFINRLWYKLDNGLRYTPETLTTYKEMKEERNITLTLDKAKEWYKKGGELKEIALQAFTKSELNPLPKTWEEFCKNYPVKKGESYLGIRDEISIVPCDVNGNRKYKNWIPSKESAEAHIALIQLEQLRNCWWGNWKLEWDDSYKYAIKNLQGKTTILECSNVVAFLVFPTSEMAEEFLKCFKDLIEKAKDLI